MTTTEVASTVERPPDGLMRRLSGAAGTHFGKATLTVRKAGDKPLEYLKIEMQDLIVSSQTIHGSSGNDQVTESITLNAAVIKQNYIEQDAKGGAGKTVAAGFDIRVGEKVA